MAWVTPSRSSPRGPGPGWWNERSFHSAALTIPKDLVVAAVHLWETGVGLVPIDTTPLAELNSDFSIRRIVLYDQSEESVQSALAGD